MRTTKSFSTSVLIAGLFLSVWATRPFGRLRAVTPRLRSGSLSVVEGSEVEPRVAPTAVLRAHAQAGLPAEALAQAGSGQIAGTVVDKKGVAVPDATVTATNKDTGLVREVKTNKTGEYGLVLLPAGRYSLAVRHEGFKTYQAADVAVGVGAALTHNATLSVAEVSAAVGITSATPLGKPKPGSASPDQLKQEAAELAELADSLPAEIERAAKGDLPKDLDQRLKRIEKLSKKLRHDLGVR